MPKVPILFLIFNRKDISLNSFIAIKKYEPSKLYIAADGPRLSHSKDKALCDDTRESIMKEITWDCEVKTLFRNENLGVDKSVYSAISWLFETEPYGVIIEDDCSVSIDFFKFCEVAFPKFENDLIVKHIGAYNPMFSGQSTQHSVFSFYPETWGWGTWKRAWLNDMDISMKSWIHFSLINSIQLNGLLLGLFFFKYWKNNYLHKEEIKTWDSIWQFSIMHKKGLCLKPQTNLAINTGIGTSEGSHFKKGDKDPYANIIWGNLTSPYIFPENLCVEKKQIKFDKIKFIYIRLFFFKNKLLKKLFYGEKNK